MANSSARIRRYEPSDEKLVRFFVGRGALEPLAVANRRGYVHPLFLGVWFALSTAMAQYLNWWPSQGHTVLKWLSPLPAFASMAVPLMFFIDWFNRNSVEDRAQVILRQRDAVDFAGYYSNAPGSDLWVLEYGKTFVGLVAIDAGDRNGKEKSGTKQAATEATIRHFYVDAPFRTTGIQDDLLAYAIRHTFDVNSNINVIKAEGNPLVPYFTKALRSAGFAQGSNIGTIGLFKWQLHEMILERAQWEKAK